MIQRKTISNRSYFMHFVFAKKEAKQYALLLRSVYKKKVLAGEKLRTKSKRVFCSYR